MKKVAFIRSVDIHQAEPSLSLLLENIKTMKKVNDLKLKLFFSDGIIHDEKIFPGEVCRFSSDASVDKLVLEIVKWSPDYVISISIPDNNSFRDSVLKEKLKKYGIPMLIHPIDSMFILCNKWNTSLWLKSQGFYVPKSIQVSYEKIANNIGVDYSEYLNAIYCSLSQMHGPFVVKPLWDSMSCGVQIFDDCSQVVEYIKKYCKQDLIIEQHVDGELFSIEVLADENNILVQPLIKKVLLDKKDLMPFNHLRYGNYHLEDNLYFNLKSNLLRIVKKLRLNGNVEFEMIRKDNKFYIIEINPRVSGVTNLSTAISGINTYSWLLLAALNNKKNFNYKKHISHKIYAEFPITINENSVLEKILNLPFVWSAQEVTYHTNEKQCKVIAMGESLEDIYKKILNIDGVYLSRNIIKEFNYEISLEEEK